jgi:hypothetical protein
MDFAFLTAMLALAAHITSCIAAYTVGIYQAGNCNIQDSSAASFTIVGAASSTFAPKSCFQVPFQGESISVTGCTSGGTVTPFTDINCITPANVAIPDTGILCLENTPLKSFSVTKC